MLSISNVLISIESISDREMILSSFSYITIDGMKSVRLFSKNDDSLTVEKKSVIKAIESWWLLKI